MIKKILILGAVALISSCAAKKVEPVSEPVTYSGAYKPLNGKTFVNTQNKNINIKFYDDRVAGFTGINNFNGKFVVTKTDEIVIKEIFLTKKAGSIQEMDVESRFLNGINGAKKYNLKEDVLTIGDYNFVRIDNK